MVQTQNKSAFPDTKIEEDVITRGPKGVLGIIDESVGFTDESKESVRFGDQPGQVIVNPLNVNNIIISLSILLLLKFSLLVELFFILFLRDLIFNKLFIFLDFILNYLNLLNLVI